MRILFVTPYIPSAMRIRPLAFIRELAARGHQVTLACLAHPAWEARYLDEVRPFCQAVHTASMTRLAPIRQVLRAVPTREPMSVAYCHSPAFLNLVADLAQPGGYDVVHTEFIRAAPATLHLRGTPRVLDTVDCASLTYRRSLTAAGVSWKQRLVSLLEWPKMHAYELWALRQYDALAVSSPFDRQALVQPGHDLAVIPNGVDAEYFNYYTGPRQPATIVFLGKMSYYVNVASVLWFYRNVFPLVRQKCPEVKFVIVGRDPAPEITALATDPSVTVTGTVTDVRPYLQQATLSVCPMVSGAGIQNKMLEAMACGAPAVATPLACQALQVKHCDEVLIANRQMSFADSVLELLNDSELRVRLSECGRQYIEQYHRWDGAAIQLEALYHSVGSR